MHVPHFTAAVLKVASRCNLNCSYCYMFNHADQTYQHQPALMHKEIASAVIDNVITHCTSHSVRDFYFVFHGGEPLLAKDQFFAWFIATSRRRAQGTIDFKFLLQTNGVLLDEDRAKTLTGLGVSIGISIDGPQRVHDRSRIDHRGVGSYAAVLAGWRAARAAGIRPGLLAVADPDQNPHEAYEHLCALRPRKVDFLFPDATHASPPARQLLGEKDAYGKWLLAVFFRWIDDEERDFEIRLFADILNLIVTPDPADGAPRRGYNGTVFVEPDGTMETLDLLRACGEGLVQTPYNVISSPLDAALDAPLGRLYYRSHEIMCDECKHCNIAAVCGGGNLAHRYSSIGGFNNPSVYCADIKILVGGIRSWLNAEMARVGNEPRAKSVGDDAP
jgi:uncharacterized protein